MRQTASKITADDNPFHPMFKNFFDGKSSKKPNKAEIKTLVGAFKQNWPEVLGLTAPVLRSIRTGLMATGNSVTLYHHARKFTSFASTIFETNPDEDPKTAVERAYSRAEAAAIGKVPEKSRILQPTDNGIVSMLNTDINWTEDFKGKVNVQCDKIGATQGTFATASSIEAIYAVLPYVVEKNDRRHLFDQALALNCSNVEESYRAMADTIDVYLGYKKGMREMIMKQMEE
ncbi:hypothetical protein BDW59DRAFT_5431 [Aspergillus cavernicola]|uniref:Uncharacterized protein n=1 Tax=Aspergillus cavernicola TaxID=176166 RepID=A0ABR4J5A8_9EURO